MSRHGRYTASTPPKSRHCTYSVRTIYDSYSTYIDSRTVRTFPDIVLVRTIPQYVLPRPFEWWHSTHSMTVSSCVCLLVSSCVHSFFSGLINLLRKSIESKQTLWIWFFCLVKGHNAEVTDIAAIDGLEI